jgi:hypothetical protein
LGADPCPATIIDAFLVDPTKAVDSSCVQQMVPTAFLLP